MTTAPKLEPWPYPGFTLDQIDEAVLSNDNISVALSEAILEATKRARAAPSAGLREALDVARIVDRRPGLFDDDMVKVSRALLTLSKERGGVASPHQTIARDE